MRPFAQLTASRLALLGSVVTLAVALSWPLLSAAQDKTADPNKHQHNDPKVQAKDLADQVRDLQAKVTQLEAALKQSHQGKPADASDAGGMGGMSMGMGDKRKMGMGMMGEQGMGMIDMDMK